jgi:hypothetical protein
LIVDHEANLALVCYRGDQIDSFLFLAKHPEY